MFMTVKNFAMFVKLSFVYQDTTIQHASKAKTKIKREIHAEKAIQNGKRKITSGLEGVKRKMTQCHQQQLSEMTIRKQILTEKPSNFLP